MRAHGQPTEVRRRWLKVRVTVDSVAGGRPDKGLGRRVAQPRWTTVSEDNISRAIWVTTFLTVLLP